MAQLPFRNPIGEDDPMPTWDPPSYAESVSEEDDASTGWKPPAYAESTDKPKPSLMQRAIEAVKNPKPFHAGPVPSATEPVKPYDENAPEFKQHTLTDDLKAAPGYFKDVASRFLHGAKVMPGQMLDEANRIGKTSAEQLKNKDYVGAAGTVASPITDVLHRAVDPFFKAATGQPDALPKINPDQAKSEVLGLTGIPVKEAAEAYQKGDYAGLAGMGASALAFHKANKAAEGFAEHVRSGGDTGPSAVDKDYNFSQRIANRDSNARILPEGTAQQDKVAIALTKDQVPRTAGNISTETGIPQPSVRRTLSEIKKKSVPLDEEARAKEAQDFLAKAQPSADTGGEVAPETPPEQPKTFVNPFTKKPIAQPAEETYLPERPYQPVEPEEPPNSVLASPEQDIQNAIAQQAQPQSEDNRPLPIRSPNLDPSLFKLGATEAQPSTAVDAEQGALNTLSNKLNMSRPMPSSIEELQTGSALRNAGKPTSPHALAEEFDRLNPELARKPEMGKAATDIARGKTGWTPPSYAEEATKTLKEPEIKPGTELKSKGLNIKTLDDFDETGEYHVSDNMNNKAAIYKDAIDDKWYRKGSDKVIGTTRAEALDTVKNLFSGKIKEDDYVPRFAKVKGGGLVIDTDIKRATQNLTKDYTSPLSGIMMREGMQNALDAADKLGEEGRVRVRITRANESKGTPGQIEIHDNGSGLDETGLSDKLVRLFASGKSDEEGATGGKGIGSASYIAGGKHFEIDTVAEDSTDGKKYRIIAGGTPDQFQDPDKGSDYHREEVPADTPTGTTIKVQLTDKQDTFHSQTMLDRIIEHSRNRPSHVIEDKYGLTTGKNHVSEMQDGDKGAEGNLFKLSSDDKLVGKFNVGNGNNNVRVYVPPYGKGSETSSIAVHYLNNGMYQFTTNAYLGEKASVAPDAIVDIHPKVDEMHDDYPFINTREDMKATMRKPIEEFIKEKITGPALKERANRTQELYDSMPIVGKSYGRNTVIFDPGKRMTPEETKAFTSNPATQAMTKHFADLVDSILITVGKDPWIDRLEGVGLVLDPGSHGLHIPNPKTGKSTILFNPFIRADEMSPEDNAYDATITGLHEAAHIGQDSGTPLKWNKDDLQNPRIGQYLKSYFEQVNQHGDVGYQDTGHKMDFAQRLGEVFAKFGPENTFNYAERLQNVFTGGQESGEYSPEFQKLLQLYSESRGRDETTEDLLSPTGVKQKRPGGPSDNKGSRGGIDSGDEPRKTATPEQQERALGGAVKRLFNSLVEAKGGAAEQTDINRAERAQRFKEFEKVKMGGVSGAGEALRKLRGEYEKVDPGRLNLTPNQADALFSHAKTFKGFDTPEKARAVTALFKLFNGTEVPQPNELKLLDRAFGGLLRKAGGPGASAGYDINEATDADKPGSFEELGQKLADKKAEPDFLTKLANFSSKTTRLVLGTHIPGTAISVHGFNEAIRNTMFGTGSRPFDPTQAVGRFANAMHYIVRPKDALKFLNTNMDDLNKAVTDGGLRISTGDVKTPNFFTGDNYISQGIRAVTDPTNLFGKVIPALKLKGYQGLLEQYQKSGMKYEDAAKTAGEATNNIFGGLNLKRLERDSTNQKVARAALLAPDWLESNLRIGKGMAKALVDPKSPQGRVYLSGISNFLASYAVMNVINMMNNDGKLSVQNDTGHELDVAFGKDSSGRVRYFSPYGTAMDFFRVPLEIAHAAIQGNIGKTFSDMRSRASEPIQAFMDLASNTDYVGRPLYGKDKYGKPLSYGKQASNVINDVSSHFLPTGIESGAKLFQGDISPEQFGAQVLQMPMKYKYPDLPPNALRLRKMQRLKP